VVFVIMKVRLPRAPTVAAIATAALLLLVAPTALAAGAAPALTPGGSYTVWAYGVVKNVSFSGTTLDGTAFEGSATYGYSVILNQTNLTSTDFELSANRTMGATLSVKFCSPNCANPTVSGTIYHRAWESVDAWANFTTAGTVLSDGQNTSAIALLNTHTAMSGSVFDTAQGPLRSALLSANVSANAVVNFTTPLGLLPDNLTAPMNWTSSAAFVASGSYALNFYYHFAGPHVKETVGPTTVSGAVNRSGEVSVTGSTQGTPALFGGVSYSNVSLEVVGPFAVREGFILVPDQVDLFGASSSGPVGSNESGSASVQMTSLYVNTHARGHLGIGGSEWVYSASSLDPSATSVTGTGTEGTAVSSGANPIGNTSVQGVPISVAQGRAEQDCLISGSTCSAAGGKAALPTGLLFAGAVVAVLAIAGTVLVAERRRMPPPAYPNAKLYPPGAPAPAPGPTSARANGERRPAPTPDDDPLSNLW
jgi:hypothetical protein